MATEKVLMEHPQLPETQEQPKAVSESSFLNVWRHRGWRLYVPGEQKATTTRRPPAASTKTTTTKKED